MKQILIVFIGSGVGGVLRYLITKWFSVNYGINFPIATFVINCIACFLVGFLLGYSSQKFFYNFNFRLLFISGFCGGFSTFSTFSSDSITLFQQGQYFTSIVYIFGSVLVCLLFTLLGLYIAGKF